MDFQTQAARARLASTELVSMNRGAKDRALHAMADHLAAAEAELLRPTRSTSRPHAPAAPPSRFSTG